MTFNSQICTTREQGERLLALGLKKETADMVWTHAYYSTWAATAKENPLYFHEADEDTIPAWSLHRLIEMMRMTLAEDRVYHEYWDLNVTPIAVIYRNQDEPSEWIGECMGQGMYNNIIDCIEWLIKEGYFNKKYLVDQDAIDEHCKGVL